MTRKFSDLFNRMSSSFSELVRTAAPVAEGTLRTLASPSGVPLPADLMALYTASDGLWIGGDQIIPPCNSLEEYGQSQRLLVLHEWGNGDADCAELNESGIGTVVFCDHSPRNCHVLCNGIYYWLMSISEELQARKQLWHPMDYERVSLNEVFLGIYAGIKIHT